MSRKENIGFSLVMVILSAVGVVYSYLKIEPTNLPIHPFVFPTCVIALILLLSLIRLVGALQMPKDNSPGIALQIPKKSLITMGLIGLYAVAYKPVGYVISTFLFLMIEIMVLIPDKKKWKLPLVVALVGSVGIYLLFTQAFNVMLPEGLLYFMY